jgi:hypothetical protein
MNTTAVKEAAGQEFPAVRLDGFQVLWIDPGTGGHFVQGEALGFARAPKSVT